MALSKNEIHLYYFNFDGTQANDTYLSNDEKTRAKRFIKEIDQNRFRFCYTKLRETLATYLKLQPHEIKLLKNPYGKPYIDDTQNAMGLQFNLSHSAQHIFFGVCLKHPLGVDVEETTRMSDLNGLAEHAFSPLEHQQFLALPENEKRSGFFKTWTCKEAFLKAIGMGMHFPLKNFSVSVSPNEQPSLLNIKSESFSKKHWELKTIRISENTLAAIATEKTDARYVLFNMPNKAVL